MATVVNKITLEVRDSVNTPDYDPAEWLINPDLTAVEGSPKRYWLLDENEALVLKDQAGREAADESELSILKEALLSQIDEKAETSITEGSGLEVPPGSGKFISMSLKAQIKWTGWNSIADNWEALGLPYPFRVRTVDDSDYVEIGSAQEVHDIYGMMAQRVAGILAGSEAVKAAVVAATTIQEAKDAAAEYLAG